MRGLAEAKQGDCFSTGRTVLRFIITVYDDPVATFSIWSGQNVTNMGIVSRCLSFQLRLEAHLALYRVPQVGREECPHTSEGSVLSKVSILTY